MQGSVEYYITFNNKLIEFNNIGEHMYRLYIAYHTDTGFYRTQYPASYTHKSLGRTPQFTLPASAGTQMCLLCLSL